jgi:hypothetical protein
VCVAVSCLSQKFGIWSLPGAFQFSVVFSSIVASVSDTGLHYTQGLLLFHAWINNNNNNNIIIIIIIAPILHTYSFTYHRHYVFVLINSVFK